MRKGRKGRLMWVWLCPTCGGMALERDMFECGGFVGACMWECQRARSVLFRKIVNERYGPASGPFRRMGEMGGIEGYRAIEKEIDNQLGEHPVLERFKLPVVRTSNLPYCFELVSER